MRKYLLLILSFVFHFSALSADNYTFCYWIDDNHTAAQTITQTSNTFSTTMDVASLPEGMHTLFVRARKNTGTWTSPKASYFYKVQDLPTIKTYYWFDDETERREFTNAGGGAMLIDVSHLKDGLHCFNAMLTNDAGSPSVPVSRTFIKMPSSTTNDSTTLTFWIDGAQYSQQKVAYGNEIVDLELDVADLSVGMHFLQVQAVTNSGSASNTVSGYFMRMPYQESDGIIAYRYWINDNNADLAFTTVENPSTPFQFISDLEVAPQPLRCANFHFEVNDDIPMLYAVNDLHMQIMAANGHLMKTTNMYAESVAADTLTAEEWTEIKNDTVIKANTPTGETIYWYAMNLEAGDTVCIKTNYASTLQVFSHSADKVFESQADSSLIFRQFIAEKDEMYYLALHTVNTTKAQVTLTVDLNKLIHYYTVATSTNGHGTVTEGGTYAEGTAITLTATSDEGYLFSQWNDGNTDNPRTLILTQDTALTAYFEYIVLDTEYKTICYGDSCVWNGKTYTTSGIYIDTLQTGIATLDLTILPEVPITNEEAVICSSEVYEWLGQTYTKSGEYSVTLSNINGCDSILTLNLTVNYGDTIEFTETACDNYEWYGEVYTKSGDYTYLTQTTLGCDSLEVLHLTIHNSEVGETEYATVCYGETYTWNGQTYAESGTYTITLSNTNGCDSVATLNLTVLPEAVTKTEAVTISSAEVPYIWRGKNYSTTGRYTDIDKFATTDCDSVIYVLELTVLTTGATDEQSVTICDSEVPYVWYDESYSTTGKYTYTEQYVGTDIDSIQHILNLTVNPTVYTEETITACDSHTWNGATYTQSGKYVYTTTAVNGCDSVVTLHLTVNQTQYAGESVTACDTYTWNGHTYTESGDYVYTTIAANGCDSIVTLHLTINQTQYAEETVVACDSYSWNGETYTKSGDYTYTTTAANGCDSIVTLHLTINNSEVGETEYATICYGETYTWNGKTYATSGEYSVILSNALGCDSVATLHLTIMPSAVTTTENVVIGSDQLPYIWRGNTYAETGLYTDVEQYTTVACDSAIHILDLTVLTTGNYNEQSVTICDTEVPYIWYGESYSATGKYTYTEQYVGTDIDSIQHILNLIVNSTVYTEEHITACDSYAWNGQSYTQSGDYTFTTVAANGCDSVITLNLTINYSGTVEYTAAACDSYEWHNQVYTKSGDYTYLTQTTLGCDSLEVLHLTINHSEIGKTEYAIVCYGETYTWNGRTYSTAGEYTITLSNTNGCDSVATLNLIVLPEAVTKTEAVTISSAEVPYIWRGKNYSTTGRYTDIEKFATTDCDSVIYVLELTVLTTGVTDEQSVTICDSEVPYVWHDESYSTTGKYTYTEQYVGTDIDSIQHILNLTVNPTVYTEETITACDSYTWNGETYTQSGEYTYTTVAANGCDSVVTLYLTINQTQYATESVVACDSYTWNGETYTQSGEYVYTTTAANGCDSIVTLHLTINQTQYAEETVVACDSYTWNGNIYTESGDYVYTTIATNGCDSVMTLHLTINQTQYATESVVACDSYTWNGETYTQSGEYTYTTVAANGCDSVVTLHLTINKTQYAEETVVACDSYTWNGKTYTVSGKYVYTTTATNGCDSIVTLHLTINQPQYAEESVTACDSYTWNGVAYTTSGEYTYTTTAANGCDSVVTLYLTILPEAITETEELVLCPSELPYEWYGYSLTEAGFYTAIEQYAIGCDSVIHELTLNVYVQTLPTQVTLPIVRKGEAIDVSIPAAEIQAHIAADTWYAPNALVNWYIQRNADWTILTTDPVESSVSEVVLKYAIDTDCGSIESEPMSISVETTAVDNIQTDKIETYKIIRDDKLWIIRNGKIYSAQGQLIALRISTR